VQHIEKALEGFIKKQGLKKQLDRQKLLEGWGKIVGEKISKNTEAVSVEGGVLIIKAKNSAWRQELQIQKIDILNSINKEPTKKLIKDIRFV
tara:strand:- start:441 stop:716 length:276 start_codon:yes stop_codon:yes gene_type:complete